MRATFYLWSAIPLLTMLTQACIKLFAAYMQGQSFGAEWLARAMGTPWLAAIIGLESVAFVLWMQVLGTTSISKAAPISSLAYILILLMSWVGFHEPVMPLQLVGSALILAGVWIISTALPQTSSESSL